MTEEQLPFRPANPADFGLDIKNNENDRWLYNESRGDEFLLLMLMNKEKIGELHAQGERQADYNQQMKRLGKEIIKRTEFLDSKEVEP